MWTVLLAFVVFCQIAVAEKQAPVLDANHRVFDPNTKATDLSEAFLEFSRSQLQTSTWPVDHGDTARSKFVFNAGLPVGVKSSDIKVVSNLNLKNAQWVYTGGPNSEYVYVMNGAIADGFHVARLDSTTLEIQQHYSLEPSLYTGGLLVHRNGHVYAIHSNVLYAFWNGDLTNCTKVRLPTELNGKFTMTNGMLVTSDGYLLVKQWSGKLSDLYFITASKKQLEKLYNAVMVVIIAITFMVMRRNRNKRAIKKTGKGLSTSKTIGLFFISACIGYVLTFTICIGGILGLAIKAQGYFNPIRFLTDTWFSPSSGGGELKLIDPITLTVKAGTTLPERCSFARMALSTIVNPEGVLEDAMVLLGDENVHQFRWRPSTSELYWLPKWSRRYRRDGDGTYPGTGPAIYNGTAYFTDNTFPIQLKSNTYRMFQAPLHFLPAVDGESEDANKRVTMKHYQLASEIQIPPSHSLGHFRLSYSFHKIPGSPILSPRPGLQGGFMFWSVAISPPRDADQSNPFNRGAAIVWDSARYVVQGRNLQNVSEINWQIAGIRQADCITVIPDRNYIYMTDYGVAPTHNADWMSATSGDPEFRSNTKYFIIADSRTGQIKVNVSLGDATGVNPSLLVPGVHNDVFIGVPSGVARLYADVKKN